MTDINSIVEQLKNLDSCSTEFSELKEQSKWLVIQVTDLTKGRPFIVDGDLIRWVDGTLISIEYHGYGMFANDEITEKYRKYRKLRGRFEEVKKQINNIEKNIAPMFVDYFNKTQEETLVIVVNDNVYTIEADVCLEDKPCLLVPEPLFID